MSEQLREALRHIRSLSSDVEVQATIDIALDGADERHDDSFYDRTRCELARARAKFPGEEGKLTDPEWLAVLAEEFGEVSHEITLGLDEERGTVDRTRLRAELAQVVAVAVRWATSETTELHAGAHDARVSHGHYEYREFSEARCAPDDPRCGGDGECLYHDAPDLDELAAISGPIERRSEKLLATTCEDKAHTPLPHFHR